MKWWVVKAFHSRATSPSSLISYLHFLSSPSHLGHSLSIHTAYNLLGLPPLSLGELLFILSSLAQISSLGRQRVPYPLLYSLLLPRSSVVGPATLYGPLFSISLSKQGVAQGPHQSPFCPESPTKPGTQGEPSAGCEGVREGTGRGKVFEAETP